MIIDSVAVTVSSVIGLTYSSNRVGQPFDLSFQSGLVLAASQLLLIKLPSFANGFISEKQTISCSIGGVNLYCIPYYGVDMVLVVVT